MLPPPLLVLVSGKPGAGKTTLARRLAETDALGLPVLSRDALKAGLVATRGAETDEVRAELVPRSFELFYETIAAWLRAGVSLIADQVVRGRSEPAIRRLTPLARAVVLHCDVLDGEAERRYVERERTNPLARPDLIAATFERMERGSYPWPQYDPPELGVPLLRVDTTRGYAPDLRAIVDFCRDALVGDE